MKNKRPFYKNGIVIGALMFIVALIITKVNFSAGAILGVSGMIVFFFSLIRALVRKIFVKETVQPTIEVEQPSKSTMPIQTPEISETPAPKQDPVEAISAPPIPEVEQLQPEAVCVELPKVVELEKQVPDSPSNDNLVVEDDVYEPTESSVILRKLSIDEFVQEADKTGFVAFDFETTGLSSDNDRITEIGAIKIDANGNEVERYSNLVNPEMHIPSGVVALTGISDDWVKDKPTIDCILPGFLHFINGYPMIAWNASFDKGFLEKNICRCNLGCNIQYIDALMWARRVYDLPSYKQGLVADHIGYVPKNVHRALGDCETLVAIVNDLMKNTTVKARFDVHYPASEVQSNNIDADLVLRGEAGLGENDQTVAHHFISLILNEFVNAELSIMKNKSYVTICTPTAYITRFHCGPQKKWIAIDSYRAELDRENQLFDAQKDKDQRFWRSNFINMDSINQYDKYVLKTYNKAISEQE